VEFKWNSAGSALLVQAQTEVDTTGRSYFGETAVHFMQADGKFDSTITLRAHSVALCTSSALTTGCGVVHSKRGTRARRVLEPGRQELCHHRRPYVCAALWAPVR
jgi:uncharacterized protein with WD repeat